MSNICPYCGEQADANAQLRCCSSCGTPHHEECWADNGGCTIFGCACAPPDETSVSVTAPDLKLRPECYGQLQKNRTGFVLLGIFLGAFGAHNFYAGYIGKAIAQLCLTLLSLFVLSPVSYLWAIVDICLVNRDSQGSLMT